MSSSSSRAHGVEDDDGDGIVADIQLEDMFVVQRSSHRCVSISRDSGSAATHFNGHRHGKGAAETLTFHLS